MRDICSARTLALWTVPGGSCGNVQAVLAIASVAALRVLRNDKIYNIWVLSIERDTTRVVTIGKHKAFIVPVNCQNFDPGNLLQIWLSYAKFIIIQLKISQ